jgi:hypothetical protein
MTGNTKGRSRGIKYTAAAFVFVILFSSCKQEDEIPVPVPTGFSGYFYPNGLPPSRPQFEVGHGVNSAYSAHFEWDPMDDVDYFILIAFTNGSRIRWSHLNIEIPGTWTSIDIQGIPRAYAGNGYPQGLPPVWALDAYRSDAVCPNGINYNQWEYWYETYINATKIPILKEPPPGRKDPDVIFTVTAP